MDARPERTAIAERLGSLTDRSGGRIEYRTKLSRSYRLKCIRLLAILPMNCEYVRNTYGVPAEIGRRVTVNGKPGIIAADRGHYIGVNFDSSKPGVILNAHPTSEVEYLEMGTVRKPSRYAARAARYREYGDAFRSFLDFCRWDASQERSWNG